MGFVLEQSPVCLLGMGPCADSERGLGTRNVDWLIIDEGGVELTLIGSLLEAHLLSTCAKF